ncbi:hypothetical protein LSAT2_031244, partial [Lamellibrachia satsuma]
MAISNNYYANSYYDDNNTITINNDYYYDDNNGVIVNNTRTNTNGSVKTTFNIGGQANYNGCTICTYNCNPGTGGNGETWNQTIDLDCCCGRSSKSSGNRYWRGHPAKKATERQKRR